MTQSILHGDPSGIPGDCVRAAVASLLDMNPANCLHFVCGSDQDPRIWWYALKGWANSNGWNVTRIGLLPRQENVPLPKFGIACGPSPRGVSHAVVSVDGEIVWDPHPSRAGILRVKEVIEFERVDDAALREWLDARRAEIERDHRDGWTGRTCYCDMPKPCVDRAYELSIVEGLRALLADRKQSGGGDRG